MDSPRLEVEVYQLVEDGMLMKNRTDGTGWDWCWADWQRDWMNATPFRYAYRCLPLTIANQTGWWIKNPVSFTATWNGRTEPGNTDFRFDAAAEVWKQWINSQFGEGIITWNTPFLFRTKPEGSRLLICGPPNYFKVNAHPLSAIIESDWISMSFTMNWKIMTPGQEVRFEVGEPLFQAIPLLSNLCQNLEDSSVSYRRLGDDPKLEKEYHEWTQGRRRFHEQKAAGEVKGNDWQKDYFQGRDALGREAASHHMTKIKPPQIRMAGSLSGQSPISPGPILPDRSNPINNPRLFDEAGDEASSTEAHSEPGDDRAAPEGTCPVDHKAAESHPQVQVLALEAAIGELPLTPNGNGVGAIERRSNPSERLVRHDHALRDAESQPEPQFSTPLAVRVDDEWRRWIAENLMIGNVPTGLVQTMKSAGILEAEAAREVELAAQSPYVKGSELLRNRLAKRDWLLTTYRKLNRLNPKSTEIERRCKLSRDEFLNEYYTTNRPVIITGMMDDWAAMWKWDLDFFEETFAGREVEVQMGRDANANYETESRKFIHKVKFEDFIRRLRTSGETNDFYLTANNNSANKKILPELWRDIVQIPEYLTQEPNGGYLWMGPPGTITPFHHDLTNNFMAQVLGRKRLKIAPSWDTPAMDNHLHVFSRRDGRTTPAEPRPSLDQPQILEFVLNPGEVLFLPIGCWHFVQGLDVSITISFTNFVFDNDFSSFYNTYGPV